MNTQTINTTQETSKEPQPSKIKTFLNTQKAALKHIFKIDKAFPYMVAALALFSLSIFITTGNYTAGGHNGIYQGLLLLVAAVLIFRACQRSMTPAVLLLIIGFGGQYLLRCHIALPLAKEYLQYIASAGVVGLTTSCFYHVR